MSLKLELPKLTELKPRIAVVGVGGAGGNAVNNMIAAGLTGVEFMVANTDAQALLHSAADERIQLGANLTEGLGAGSKPEIGEAAAEEAIDELRARLNGSHLVFIAAGMGGGTGTGAASVIARVAQELGILTVAVVTKPFQFEGTRRMRIAEAGIVELKKHVDTLIVIPNQNLFRIANERTTFAEAFVLADQVLYSGIACIVDLIVKEGLINLDLADVRTVLAGMGSAMMGTGEAAGDRRAIVAAEEAISNPLLDEMTLRGAKGLLLSIIGGRDLTLYEVDEAASRVRQEVDPEANIIVGATFDESLGDRVRVSIVASGMARTDGAAAAGTHAAQAPPRHAAQPEAALPPGWPPRVDPDRTPHAPPPPLPQSGHPHAAHGHQQPFTHAPAPHQARPALPRHDRSPHTDELDSQPESPYGQDPGTFVPQATTEIRRTARRIPDIDEFPEVGQREYRAKTGGASAPVRPQPAPQVYHQAKDAPERKSSLLQRLVGAGRKPAPVREDDPEDGRLPPFLKGRRHSG